MTALELIKRLTDDLATTKRLLRDMDYRGFDDHTIITQARAFLDGAVEFEQESVNIVARDQEHWLSASLSNQDQLLDNGYADARREIRALSNTPVGPVTVAIIVRPKGAG
jgi:hypothetical protein